MKDEIHYEYDEAKRALFVVMEIPDQSCESCGNPWIDCDCNIKVDG